MEDINKSIIPGFQSNSDVSKWVKSLDEDTRNFIKKAAQTMEQLNYLKWGVSNHDEVLSKIKIIQQAE